MLLPLYMWQMLLPPIASLGDHLCLWLMLLPLFVEDVKPPRLLLLPIYCIWLMLLPIYEWQML